MATILDSTDVDRTQYQSSIIFLLFIKTRVVSRLET